MTERDDTGGPPPPLGVRTIVDARKTPPAGTPHAPPQTPPARTIVEARKTPPVGTPSVPPPTPARTIVEARKTPPAGTPSVARTMIDARKTPPAGTPNVTTPGHGEGVARAPNAGAISSRTTVDPRKTPPPAERTVVTAKARGEAPPSVQIDIEADDTSGVELEPGARLEQFELIREIGRGGMGQVFLARDTRLARLVALKFLGQATSELTQRFLVEARATARCQHENIVLIYEADEWQGKPYMALEFLEGDELEQILGGKTLPASRVVELIVPVVRALVRAHELDIVHCDLKPANIFVTKEGVVKVLDFGIARALQKDAPTSDDEAIAGTMPYMAPEQWGAGDIDHRTDLWAIGIILWQMLTARHPLDPISPQKLVYAASMLDQPMPRIGDAMPEVMAGLEAIVDRCLAKRKEERFANARELLVALEPLLPGRFGRKLDTDDSPFPGMTAFQEGDADRFFGRGRDVAHMVARLGEMPLVGVVAPSGVGKSSFIRAGLIPALKSSGETWEMFVLRPGRTPLASLAMLLQGHTRTSARDLGAKVGDHEQLVARLREEPGYLGALLRERARQKQERILLFVDQFEELYTQCPDLDERRAFTACLAGVADDATTPLRVVVSMRSDFLDRVAEDRTFMDRLTRGLLFLPPIDREGMREALATPLQMSGFRFGSEAMVDDMLDQLAASSGTLPLLQFTAARLWEARDRERRVLSEASYQAIGGVAGALATHADHVLASMTPERQKLTRTVMLRLVTAEGTRATVDVSELAALHADPSEVQALLDQLVAARLLAVQAREQDRSIEIVHESLITKWPALRRWIEESAEDASFLDQLRTAAKQWDTRGRAVGLLWRGEAMEDARAFARRYKGALGERDRAFLDAVLADAMRATRRRRRLIVAAFAILTGLVAAAAVALVWIRGAEAEAQKERATAQKAEIEARQQRDIVQKQLDTIKKAEDDRAKAEAGRQEAVDHQVQTQTKLVTAETQKAETAEELKASNEKLRGALETSKTSQRKAEDASTKAEKAAADLKIALDREKARVKELEIERKKLMNELR